MFSLKNMRIFSHLAVCNHNEAAIFETKYVCSGIFQDQIAERQLKLEGKAWFIFFFCNYERRATKFFFIDVAKFSNTSYIFKNNLGKILGLAISIFYIKMGHSVTVMSLINGYTNLLVFSVCLYPTCLFKPTLW